MFLLSYDEAIKYFHLDVVGEDSYYKYPLYGSESSRCKSTSYAKITTYYGSWWFRSQSNYDKTRFNYIDGDGRIKAQSYSSFFMVRPDMWIKP